mgnify:CR=1 FL=1
MATIEERLKNVRTMEDIVYLLSILFTNLNNQNKMYYDMFINTTPMDIELERYDENGELNTITLPNRAKDRLWILTGKGSPIGKVAARIGSLYLDTESQSLFFKYGGTDESSVEWERVWSTGNLRSGIEFLSPTGNGSQLTDLNASQIVEGVLPVPRGGTGTQAITRGYLVQGNGEDSFSGYNLAQVITSNFSEFVGMIMWAPMETISGRWLVCDGQAYSRSTYSDLFEKIGTKYGSGDGSTTFNVPNLIGRYVKGGVLSDAGTIGEGGLKKHTHTVTGDISEESEHQHGPGSINCVESWADFSIRRTGAADGCFSFTEINQVRSDTDGDAARTSRRLHFTLEGKLTGATGEGSPHKHNLENLVCSEEGTTDKNEVDHIILTPVIRY